MSDNSFAAKYAKKSSNFTSKALQSKDSKQDVSKSSESVQESLKKKKSNLKPIDPQKKMKAELIYLVKGVDDNRNAWYYVLVDRLKVQLFLKALNDEIIHLENYGKILFSAYGENPSEDITQSLKEEYGI